MWWKASPQDIFRIEDRVSSIYVERCHIDREDNAVVFINKDQTVRLPVAMVGVIYMGPGTRVTHAAMALMGNSGTTACWVGEKGIRYYAHGSGPSTSASLLYKQAYLVTNQKTRLAVATQMYSMRFPDEDVSNLTMQQLRGREGYRVKNIYKSWSKQTNIRWTGREYKAGAPEEKGDPINKALSIAHSCLYGICHAAIVGIGLSPALGFVHTGNSKAFVLDIADLYKAETTIPLAFNLVSEGKSDERAIRLGFRDKVVSNKLMKTIVNDVKALMQEDRTDLDNNENHLWDEFIGEVSGGVNWANNQSNSEEETLDGVVLLDED